MVLAEYLAGEGSHPCGPADPIKTKAEIRRLPRGASEWRQREGTVATVG